MKKAARDRWCANGHPQKGPPYKAKINTRAEFCKRMRVGKANDERKRIQHFDSRFKQKSSNQFRIPKANAHQSLPLRINQDVVTDPNTILTAWRDHFQTLSSTNQVLSTATYSSEEDVKRLMHDSLNKEDLLDILFEPEEIDSEAET